MNTLCEAVEAPQPEKVWEFQYPVIAPVELPCCREAGQAEREMRLQRAHEAALAIERQKGTEEGERRALQAMEEKLSAERQAVVHAVEQFAAERRSYFHRVEADVVTLALAIARKLLRREAQIDPLLLSGVVRVTLDQIQAGSQVRLRCSPEEADAWQKFLSARTEMQIEVAVVADEKVESGQVIVETSSGKAEISLQHQLQEIESGFLDLLREDAGTRHEQPFAQLL